MVGGAGRLVRRHRALPPPAGAADPAHGDHPDEEGRARRQPRRLRRRELPRRGRRARQARPRRGGRRGSGRGSARRPTPTGSPPSSRRPRAASSRCCATTTCRRSSSRSSSASSWRSRSARRSAPCCRGCSPTGRTTGWSTSSATAPTTGSRGNQEMVLRIVHERAPGWTPAVPRRHRRRQGVRRGAELRVGGEDRPGAPAAQGDRHVPRGVRHRPAERPRHDRARRADQAPGGGAPRRAEVHRAGLGHGEEADPRRRGGPVQRAADAGARRAAGASASGWRPTPSCGPRSTAGSATPPGTSCGTTGARSPR